MKTKYLSVLFIYACILVLNTSCLKKHDTFEIRKLSDYVDPLIGVRGENNPSNCVIGPQMPFGSINPSPDTKSNGKPGNTDGYDPNEEIIGFSQTHVSGTGGCGKYGNFLISPQVGLKINSNQHSSQKSDEISKAYYYAVRLKKYDINVEFSPTHNSAIYRFTYPKTDSACILIDVVKTLNICNDQRIQAGNVTINPKMNEITGWVRLFGGWEKQSYNIYFSAKISKPITDFGVYKNGKLKPNLTKDSVTTENDSIGCYLKYSTSQNEQIELKIAISFVSIENAAKYLEKEIPDWNINAIKEKGLKKWDEALSCILIDDSTATKEQLTIFYTALYHSMIMPRNRTEDNILGTGKPYYDDQYCVWDTYRSMFPLMAIIKESFVRDNVNSFIDRYKIHGKVRDAFIAGNEGTPDNVQGGDDVDCVIADAYVKGIGGIDWSKAYEVLKYDAEHERLQSYIENNRGWVPDKTCKETRNACCSKTLEFSYNDFCTSQVAKGLGYDVDYRKYLKRSKNWQVLCDTITQSDGFRCFIRPKDKDGNWLPYEPKKWYTWDGPYYYEGSPWTYSYLVPHDLLKLIELTGGKETFVKKLEHACNSGLLEIYNEPGFLAVRSFNYAGRPDLNSFYVRKIMESFTINGVPGNEDSGAMSSWYIFSALGFFPNAGQDVYLINGPNFKKITVQMENGKKIVINAKNASKKNMYVQKVLMNNQTMKNSWFTHNDIKNGVVFSFEMGDKPSEWCKNGDSPYSVSFQK